jgi:hypothetical protein
MDTVPGLDGEKAKQIRQTVTLADSRRDYGDRHLLFHSPSHQIAKHCFWEDGKLRRRELATSRCLHAYV